MREITSDKKSYLPLLLLADPEEAMIDGYLERGRLFVRFANEEVIAVAVVTDNGGGTCELKNLAVAPAWQQQGIGSEMLADLAAVFKVNFQRMLVGTANSSVKALRFYEKNGFVFHHVLPNFFVDHYQAPIFEDGVQCVDMIYLVKELG